MGVVGCYLMDGFVGRLVSGGWKGFDPVCVAFTCLFVCLLLAATEALSLTLGCCTKSQLVTDFFRKKSEISLCQALLSRA